MTSPQSDNRCVSDGGYASMRPRGLPADDLSKSIEGPARRRQVRFNEAAGTTRG